MQSEFFPCFFDRINPMDKLPPIQLPPRLVRFTLFLLLGLLVGILVGYRVLGNTKQKSVTINNHEIIVKIADTQEKISNGLSGKGSLLPNTGMLFLLNELKIHSFWMKDMKFNLDFIFIDGLKVVDIKENVTFPKIGETPITVIAKEKFDKVLEINAGEIKRMGIEVDQDLRFTI